MTETSTLLDMIKSGKNKYTRSARTTKIKEGKTRVRILKSPADMKFWRDLGVHWIKTEQDGKVLAVVGCHDAVYEDNCPVCTAISKAVALTTDDETLKIVKGWGARKSILVNALIRDGANANQNQAVILELTTTTFSQVLSVFDEYLSADVDPFDFDKGMDLIIERRGSGMDSEYTVMTTPKSDPVSKAARGSLNDLDDFIKREFFKGDEKKALRVIASFVGDSSIEAIGAPRAVGALAGPMTSVVDADVLDEDDVAALEGITAAPSIAPEPEPVAVKPPAPKATAAPIASADLTDIMAELDNL